MIHPKFILVSIYLIAKYILNAVNLGSGKEHTEDERSPDSWALSQRGSQSMSHTLSMSLLPNELSFYLLIQLFINSIIYYPMTPRQLSLVNNLIYFN